MQVYAQLCRDCWWLQPVQNCPPPLRGDLGSVPQVIEISNKHRSCQRASALAKDVCGCSAYQSTTLDASLLYLRSACHITPHAAGRAVGVAGAGRINVVEAVAAYQMAADAAAPKADGGVPCPEHLCPEHLCHV